MFFMTSVLSVGLISGLFLRNDSNNTVMVKLKNTNKLSVFINAIVSLFAEKPFRPMNSKQVSRLLGVTDPAGKEAVAQVLEKLLNEGLLIEDRPYRYLPSQKMFLDHLPKNRYVVGTVDMKTTGKAYVVPDDPHSGQDVFIASGNTGKALNGDKVKVCMFPKRSSKKPEGKIVEVLSRKKTDFVGILKKSGKYAFVECDHATMPLGIFIPDIHNVKANDGDKVIARLTEWPDDSRNPFGEVVEVLGRPGDNDVEMKSILAEYQYPISFPQAVVAEAEAIPAEVDEAEIARRRDFRKVFTVTIDPADAKDFDDAVSVRKLKNGNWEVGVHIADVSHYVRQGSAIDAEAFDRGTSIYLVDRTIPMLPEKLCNNVCSLRPNEDKLAFSVVFEMDDNADIKSHWIGKTVIRSDRRYAYEEVQDMIDGAEGDNKENIMILNGLASKLREKRMKEGSINFHSEEVKFILDENAKPIDTYVKEQTEANMLIEDWMLLANRTVAETFGSKTSRYKNNVFVYRVHDEPNPEKLNVFVQLVSKLGYSMDISSRYKLVKSYNKLFEDVEGRGEKNLVQTVALRTMARARYSTVNIGHYGLAFPYYTHFTSPIRRYPDLMVHRLIERYLIENKPSVNRDEFEERCNHASDMERRAADMERDSVKYKQTEFLEDKVGKVFDGLVSGVSKWGLFVELEGTKCEGLVRYNDIDDDFYYLDEDNFRIVGHSFGRTYQLGDPVRVRVKNVDMFKKQLDFELIGKSNPAKGKPTAKTARKSKKVSAKRKSGKKRKG